MPKITDLVRSGRFVVTSELNPPKGLDLAPMLATARRLALVVPERVGGLPYQQALLVLGATALRLRIGSPVPHELVSPRPDARPL